MIQAGDIKQEYMCVCPKECYCKNELLIQFWLKEEN